MFKGLIWANVFFLFVFGILLPAEEEFQIPLGKGVILDGKISQMEWTDALEIGLNFQEYGNCRVLIKHDGQNLNFCFKFDMNNPKILTFPELYIDPLNNGGEEWQADDWWLHLSGTDCESKGKPDVYTNCRVKQKTWLGEPNFKMGKNTTPMFEFEIQVPFDKLPVAKGKPFRMVIAGALFIPGRTSNQDFYGFYPQNAKKKKPHTWGKWVVQ